MKMAISSVGRRVLSSLSMHVCFSDAHIFENAFSLDTLDTGLARIDLTAGITLAPSTGSRRAR